MEKEEPQPFLKCIDHQKECSHYCKNDRCMFPILCSKCLKEHNIEYSVSHEIIEIDTLFENQEKKLEFIEEYNKNMDSIESETQDKKEILKGAYSEFTHEVLQACHKYYINNSIDNVLENLRNEFEMSKAEYQNQMSQETLRKMAEDYLKLRKVDDAIKNNSMFIMTKEQIFQNIENELENLNGMVRHQLNNLEDNYKKQLLNVVDYDIERHLDKLLNKENDNEESDDEDGDDKEEKEEEKSITELKEDNNKEIEPEIIKEE